MKEQKERRKKPQRQLSGSDFASLKDMFDLNKIWKGTG